MKKISGPKNFSEKSSKKNSRAVKIPRKKFLEPKNALRKKFLEPKILKEKILEPKNRPRKFLEPKISSKKISGAKNSYEKNFSSQKFQRKIL